MTNDTYWKVLKRAGKADNEAHRKMLICPHSITISSEVADVGKVRRPALLRSLSLSACFSVRLSDVVRLVRLLTQNKHHDHVYHCSYDFSISYHHNYHYDDSLLLPHYHRSFYHHYYYPTTRSQ
jgi:hypothetical protein